MSEARKARSTVFIGVMAYRIDGGRRSYHVTQNAQVERSRTPLSRMELAGKVWSAKNLGIAPRTRMVNKSHWAYWRRLCGVWGVDTIRVVALGANREESMSFRLKNELNVQSAFAAFIVFAPREFERRRSTNSVNYAEQVISSVRGNYAGIYSRRPGLSNGALGERT